MKSLWRRYKKYHHDSDDEDDMEDFTEFVMRVMKKEIPVTHAMAKTIKRNRRAFRHFVNPSYSMKSKRKYLNQKGGMAGLQNIRKFFDKWKSRALGATRLSESIPMSSLGSVKRVGSVGSNVSRGSVGSSAVAQARLQQQAKGILRTAREGRPRGTYEPLRNAPQSTPLRRRMRGIERLGIEENISSRGLGGTSSGRRFSHRLAKKNRPIFTGEVTPFSSRSASSLSIPSIGRASTESITPSRMRRVFTYREPDFRGSRTSIGTYDIPMKDLSKRTPAQMRVDDVFDITPKHGSVKRRVLVEETPTVSGSQIPLLESSVRPRKWVPPLVSRDISSSVSGSGIPHIRFDRATEAIDISGLGSRSVVAAAPRRAESVWDKIKRLRQPQQADVITPRRAGLAIVPRGQQVAIPKGTQTPMVGADLVMRRPKKWRKVKLLGGMLGSGTVGGIISTGIQAGIQEGIKKGVQGDGNQKKYYDELMSAIKNIHPSDRIPASQLPKYSEPAPRVLPKRFDQPETTTIKKVYPPYPRFKWDTRPEDRWWD